MLLLLTLRPANLQLKTIWPPWRGIEKELGQSHSHRDGGAQLYRRRMWGQDENEYRRCRRSVASLKRSRRLRLTLKT